jgi:non-ribosomal peptide synthase protein (TIGR01720 family)
MDAVILAAVADALAPWVGRGDLLVDAYHHGRTPPFDDVDVSRTVGWFTSVYPLSLPLTPGADPAATARAVDDRLAEIPRNGLDYGVLRHLAGDADLTVWPQVTINYVGRTDNPAGGATFRDIRSEQLPDLVTPTDTVVPELVHVQAGVRDGRFTAVFRYSRNRHRASTIQAAATRFEQVLLAQLANEPTT